LKRTSYLWRRGPTKGLGVIAKESLEKIRIGVDAAVKKTKKDKKGRKVTWVPIWTNVMPTKERKTQI